MEVTGNQCLLIGKDTSRGIVAVACSTWGRFLNLYIYIKRVAPGTCCRCCEATRGYETHFVNRVSARITKNKKINNSK